MSAMYTYYGKQVNIEIPYGFTYEHNGAFRYVVDTISGILDSLSLLDGPLLMPDLVVHKVDNQFIDHQNPEIKLLRNYENDRIFPLETVEIQKFRGKHYDEVETAMVHVGSYADELARTYNAFAITIATDIFFRSGYYHPEQEEGRQILAHELTHIAQHEEGRIKESSNLDELEAEAEATENREKNDSDTQMTIELNGKLFTFPRAKMKEYAEHVAYGINKLIENKKFTVEEDEYLKMLILYGEWIRGRLL